MKPLLLALKRSLPNRILLVFVLTALLIAVLVFSLVVRGFSIQWRNTVSPHLVQYLEYVIDDIGNPPDLERARELAAQLPINIYINGPGTRFSSNAQALDLSNLEFHQHQRRFSRRQRSEKRLDDINAEFGSHRDRTVLRSTVGEYHIYYELPHRKRRGDRDHIIARILLGILLLLSLCYLIFRHMLRPVQDLKTAVERMGDGELSYRAPIRADNDLGQLAGSINTMADDIEKMLDAKRQLLLGVSHELRSPLTRATIAAQMLEDSKHSQQIQTDLKEMENLLSEILETERINSSHAVIQRSDFDLLAVAESILSELSADGVELVSEQRPFPVSLDEARLRLLLRNLISNALKHGADAERQPQLRLSRQRNVISIEARDWGPGIDAEHLSQVTEPFYRVDRSRTRSTGGFGLGLYLCKLIAEAHQGELLISSETGQGTTVSALLSDPAADD